MKKIFFILMLMMCSLSLVACEKSTLKKITVSEVAHSVFYAPSYVALELGYFEEEGLDVEIVLTSGADNVMAAVLSGDADIGFSGSEATIYVYNGGEEEIRTLDPHVANVMLYQLSYFPIC